MSTLDFFDNSDEAKLKAWLHRLLQSSKIKLMIN